MGTRSLTHVFSEKSDAKPLLTIYCQCDGYPIGGLGEKLAKFCGRFTLVNGFSAGQKEMTHANGIECFAAQLVKFLKHGIGNVYIYPAGSRDCDEEYTYSIYPRDGKLRIHCDDEDFDGTPEEFIKFYKERE